MPVYSLQQAVAASPYVVMHSFAYTCHLARQVYTTEVDIADCSFVAYSTEVVAPYMVDLVHGIELVADGYDPNLVLQDPYKGDLVHRIELVDDGYSLDLVLVDRRSEWRDVGSPGAMVDGSTPDHVPAAADNSGRCKDAVHVDRPGESWA